MPTTTEKLQQFVNFCQTHITGSEKSEAQIFLDRFFRAFGHEGALEAGAIYEQKITKGNQTRFADLVWKPRVLIEMKKRGENLTKHYSQAFDYWVRAVPNRPQYVILCNFDEFWIFDFDNQLDTPKDIILLSQIPQRASAFGFMEVTARTPVFSNNQVEITERTARRLGELFTELKKASSQRGFDQFTAQRFILQCVLAMFAEDRELLPRDIFISCIQDCLSGGSSYDIIGGLFREMNTPGITPAGRYQGVAYFNGGLFSQIAPIQLSIPELRVLDACAREDWSKIRPAIFGNIFEGSVDAKHRHARGIHFTSEADIMNIVRPTISRYWEERIDTASTIKELNQLQLELQSYRVLDPACGSGNFLYIAYQELKRIEQLLLAKIASRRRSAPGQIAMGFVTPMQFYGMDTNPFAVELARVTLTIARKVAIDKLGLDEPALPLDSLDKNIVCADALFTPWPKADAIIGNPPFLGGKHIRINLGDEYADRVFAQFPEVKDSVDFCAYWFRLAHDNLEPKGRAGLVATNSISQNKSRAATLDYITQNGGYIHEAIASQPWSGEAKVHVSIVNWCKEPPDNYYLDNLPVSRINSSLQSHIDVSQAVRLAANANICFQGVIPVGKGFIISPQQAQEWIKADAKNQEVLKLLSSGSDLTDNPQGTPTRWIIDFNDMSLEAASDYPLPFAWVKAHVKPERDKNRRDVTRVNWWKFGEKRPAMRLALDRVKLYFTVSRVSKWFIFLPAQINWLPGDSTTVVASDDFYLLGILTSQVHRLWVMAQSSTLKGDTRYTHNSCFETFPFPQRVAAELVGDIREAMQNLHQYRTAQMAAKQWGITQLYNNFYDEPSSELFKLHQKLDKLVLRAYGWTPEDDILGKLLELNREFAAKEAG
ncbi:DNA methyltransferase [[Phormidium] sp. ETS-05]|uniref:class I SAM-dependent DNA methyltransferase n=1 Tax=[Phormidium] sp. ETS-05 TaxID=222819 RepID=UPI0018EF265A|nr:DNA methyltransferase [[Phormidium] sp. ETS-05]